MLLTACDKIDLINLAIIAANNHYAGFGPGTANIFRGS